MHFVVVCFAMTPQSSNLIYNHTHAHETTYPGRVGGGKIPNTFISFQSRATVSSKVRWVAHFCVALPRLFLLHTLTLFERSPAVELIRQPSFSGCPRFSNVTVILSHLLNRYVTRCCLGCHSVPPLIHGTTPQDFCSAVYSPKRVL